MNYIGALIYKLCNFSDGYIYETSNEIKEN